MRGRPKKLQILSCNQVNNLPDPRQFRREGFNGLLWIDKRREQLLVESAGEHVFPQAPPRCEPVRGHEEDDGLATVGRGVQGPFPAFASGDAANWIEIQKDIVPALRYEPIFQGDGFEILLARMAEENARHPVRSDAVGQPLL